MALKHILAFVYLFASAHASAGVEWTVPDGGFTSVTTTLTVPENLVMQENTGYIYGVISTYLTRVGYYIANTADIISTGNIDQVPIHAQLAKFSFDDYLWVGDKVKAIYTKDTTNVTHGTWSFVASVSRGPAGVAAGGLPFSRSETWSGNNGGNTVLNKVQLYSFTYAGKPVTRKIKWNNIAFKATTRDTTWCTNYAKIQDAPGRNFSIVGGVGAKIPSGSSCTFTSISFNDPTGLES